MDKLARYASTQRLGFELLSDPQLEVMAAWGLVNPKKPSVPHPTAVVVDADGVVRYFRQDVDYTKRPPASELLAAIDGL